MALTPLAIVEAVGKEIKLTNVPAQGATARILVPPNPDPDGVIDVLIADQKVVTGEPVGAPVGGFYEVLVPRNALLNHTGLQRSVTYVLYDTFNNPDFSDPIDYDILHS